MAHPQIAAFARMAEENPKPTRAIAGQHSQITRTIHDLAYDPIHDEISIPQFYAYAIMTYKGDANGDVPPIRVIMGDKTQLKNPQRLGVDPVHNEIFVPQGRRVLVFDRTANGNVAPIRILEGPDTQLGASALAIDPVHNLLIVSGGGGGGDDEDTGGGGRAAAAAGGGGGAEGRVVNQDGSAGGGGRLLIFDRTAQGNS